MESSRSVLRLSDNLIVDDLEHGDKLLVKIKGSTKFKLGGIPVDENGEIYENAPEIRLWAGHNTALKKSNFGDYAEVGLMGVGFRKGQLRAKILQSGDDKQFRNSVHRDWIQKLSINKNNYEPPLSELSEEELCINPPTTKENQNAEGSESKHEERDDDWAIRKSDTMNKLPDL